MDERVDALQQVLARSSELLRRVDETDRSLPTVCDEWDVGGLIGHMVGSTCAFADVLDDVVETAPARVAPEAATPAVHDAAAARCVAGWRRAFSEAREFGPCIELDTGIVIPPIPLPASMLIDIQLLDAGVHVHDLRMALGLPATDEDRSVAPVVSTSARAVLVAGIRELAGFAEEREAPVDAGPVEQLLSFVGRPSTEPR